VNDPACNHNLPLTFNAFAKLANLDETLVGTRDYLGLASYWAGEYKQFLRIATPKQRKLVHDRLLSAGLKLNGVSAKHKAIVEKVLLAKAKKVYGLS
jgi:hypothetical protein